jgi:hypothetical protein
MYYIFVLLLAILIISVLFVNYNSFQIKEHKFWLASLLLINVLLCIFIVSFYYKKKYEPGATGYVGYEGKDGINGNNFNICSSK